MIETGRVGQGINMVDRVGRLTPTDSDSMALRDKANLALGYHFLKDQQGGTAVPLFGRVRTNGPYSTKALLGLGWAYLAPRGTRQKKTEIGDEKQPEDNTTFATIGVLLRPGYVDSDSVYRRAGLAPFHLVGRSADEEAQLKQALVPWVELTSRDSIDPAVQEGLLAIPYVLDHLGAHVQAQQYYERAIASLEETRGLLDRAEYNVRSGRMVQTMVDNYDPTAESGWRWKLKSLPNAAETFYLQRLIADNDFQEELKDFRDVRLLQHQLDFWKARLSALEQGMQAYGAHSAPAAATSAAPAAQAAKSGGASGGASSSPPLLLADHLGAQSGAGGASGAAGAEPPVALHLTQNAGSAPYAGIPERMQQLRSRIDTLLPPLAAAEKSQGLMLQKIGISDLEKQKADNQKYLADTRFALARVYDSELKSPAAGDSK
jgi:hypothetical protein